MKQREVRLVDELRKNSRRSLTEIGYKTGIHLSTVFKGVKKVQGRIITKHTCLVDFAKLGFPLKVGVFLSTNKINELKDFLESQPNINSLVRLSGDFAFYAEFLFKDMVSYQDFMDELEDLSIIKNISAHFITDIKREEFKIGGKR